MRVRLTFGLAMAAAIALNGLRPSWTRAQSERKFQPDRTSDDARPKDSKRKDQSDVFAPMPFGGPGGPMGQQQELVGQFDADGDGKLDRKEREAAREFLKKARSQRGRRFGPPGGPPPGEGPKDSKDQAKSGERKRPDDFPPGGDFFRKGGPPGGFGGPGFMGARFREKPKPGKKIAPAKVASVAGTDLYDSQSLRTIFIDFADKDWETELADFYHTDVEVPATLIVDGKTYPNVGVHFRGASSYFTVPEGFKRSLNVSMDFGDGKQRLYGQKTLNLLNLHEDDSCLSSVLYSHIARQYLPAPKANFVRVVINGENWGIYANVQQFNKDFVQENFKSSKGARWKVKGSPGGGGGLDYLGDDIERYRRRYEIKSGDDNKSWKALIQLTKVLSKTPTAELKAAIEPILDVDQALWFLALDIALINCDGYWIRASDYSLYRDERGKFHLVPHDMNEAFRLPIGPGMGGPGRPGGPGPFGFALPGEGKPKRDDEPKRDAKGKPANDRGRGMRAGPNLELDPLLGMDDPRKPLRSKMLQVPEYRARYLAHLKTIAEKSMDWKIIGPFVAQQRQLIGEELAADTRKLTSTESFERAVADSAEETSPQARRPGAIQLRTFFEKRRTYLLNYLTKLETHSKDA